MPTFGAIYIAHNPTDGSNVYKVGLTERSVPERMAELTASTSNLGKYVSLGYVVVTDVQLAEKLCHAKLEYCRVQQNREFFSESLETITRIVRECCRPFEVKAFLPETKPEKIPEIRNLVSSTLEKGSSEKEVENEHHLKINQIIKEQVQQLLPSLAELQAALPIENLKVVLHHPRLEFDRAENPSVVTEVNLIDVIFFGKLVKPPIKISMLKNRVDEFLASSRTKQSPQVHPSGYWQDNWCAFDDDGRWLDIRGRIACDWRKPKDARNGYYLFGHSLSITVRRIVPSELGSDIESAQYETRDDVTAYFEGANDFLKILAIVCAENAALCPRIDRSFSVNEGRHRKYAKLSGAYVSQAPVVESLKPYMTKSQSGIAELLGTKS